MRSLLPLYFVLAAFVLSGCSSHVLMSKNGPDGTKVEIQSVDVVTGKDATGEYETTKITWKNIGTSTLHQARIDFKSYDVADKVICRATGWPLVAPLTSVSPETIQVTDTGRTYIGLKGMPRSKKTEILALYGLEAENKSSGSLHLK